MFEDEIIEHAQSEPSDEVCGFIVLQDDLSIKIERAINESPTRRSCFSISPSRFLEYKLNKNILGIYHSHPFTTEKPSKNDKAMSEESGIPYLVYSLKTKNFFLYFPESYEAPPLLQRPYVKAFFECSCIFKDYYKEKLGVNITKWNPNYWLPEDDKKANKLLIKILNSNMEKIKPTNIKIHDVIVFQLKPNTRLHVGVYSEQDTFIHQPDALLSKEETLDDRWQNKIKYVYRHHSLV